MRLRLFKILFFSVIALSAGTCTAQLTYATLRVVYDTPWTYKNLQLIPVRFKGKGDGIPAPEKPAAPILSLEEAMMKGKIKIKEIKSGGGADVNMLEVKNNSKQPVMINGGEMVGGGKQDRMMAETKILPPGKSGLLNVYCIEKGRWDKKAKSFSHSGSANSDLRKVMDTKKRQQEVWKEINRQYKVENKTDEAWSFLKLYGKEKRYDTGYLNFFRRKYAETDSTFAGFIAVTGNRIINVELFHKPELTNAAFLFMLNSLISTAINNGSKPTLAKEKIVPFMDNLLTTEPQQKIFIQGRGKIDRYENRVIHLIAYGE